MREGKRGRGRERKILLSIYVLLIQLVGVSAGENLHCGGESPYVLQTKQRWEELICLPLPKDSFIFFIVGC